MSDIRKESRPLLRPSEQKASQEEDVVEIKRFNEEAEKVRDPSPPPGQTNGPQRVKSFNLGDSERPCNYIFTVGRQGSGKTTLQSYIFRYLLTQREHIVTPDVELTLRKPQYREVLREWNERWKMGLFPDGTPAKNPVDMRWTVTPHPGNKKYRNYPEISFGFLEISGEDFKSLNDMKAELMPSLEKFLKATPHSIAFVFVARGDSIDKDDDLFYEFLEYLYVYIDPAFREKCSALLVLADPDECKRILAASLGKSPDNRRLNVEGFVERFTPKIARQLEHAKWGKRAAIVPFSVGEFGKCAYDDGKERPTIIKPSFDDTRVIFDWLYEQFTHRRPVDPADTLLGRTRSWLESFGR